MYRLTTKTYAHAKSLYMWLGGIAVVAYVFLLISNISKLQDQLRSASEYRFQNTFQEAVRATTDLFAVKGKNLKSLARSSAISDYFDNKALGMSLKYGLNVNQAAILQELKAKPVNASAPDFERLVFQEDDGTLVAETGEPSALDGLMAAPAACEVSAARIDFSIQRLFLIEPVLHKGSRKGCLYASVKLDHLRSIFKKHEAGFEGKIFLLGHAGAMLFSEGVLTKDRSKPVHAASSLGADFSDSLFELEGRSNDVLKMLSQDYPDYGFSMLALVPEAKIYGRLSSNFFLNMAILFPLVIVGGGVFVMRLRRQADNLAHDKDVLKGENTTLAKEISRRKAAESELRESEMRYRAYVEHAPVGILITDTDNVIVDVNPAMSNLLNFQRTQLRGENVQAVAMPDLVAPLLGWFKEVREIGRVETELTMADARHNEHVVRFRSVILPDQALMSYCVDITQSKKDQASIYRLAYYDVLTGLPNRRLLLERLRHAMAVSGRTGQFGALLFLDLDHFKNLNDTLGHDVGDKFLKMVAARLSATMRETDVVCRLGGDEFVIMAENIGCDHVDVVHEVEKIAIKLLDALNKPYLLEKDKAPYHSTCSFGISIFSGTDMSVDELLKQADVALYQAKTAGRNGYRFFNPEMQKAIERSSYIENGLRDALNKNELQMYCQPQVNRDGHLLGGEILLRWSPVGAPPVTPDAFIEIAERTGLILQIDDWVMEQTIMQLRQWQDVNGSPGLMLSVNISARQFHQPDFVDKVKGLLRKHGVDPRLLKIEITERTVLMQIDDAVERMRELKEIGIKFSLDDFGTGYSSLAYLKQLPLDEVKIDKSFIRNITEDHNDAAIVRAVIAISDALGLEVLAEGVETVEQSDCLDRYGCYQYQGYLFGKPVPIEQFKLPALEIEST